MPGEDTPKVVYRLVDAEQYAGRSVVVVGGGISGLCTAQALVTKHAGAARRVLVTESRERVGGNITTVSVRARRRARLPAAGSGLVSASCTLRDGCARYADAR